MKVIFGLLLLVAVASGQDTLQAITDVLNAIVQPLVKLAEFLESIAAGIKKAIKDSCDQNGGPGAYENLTKFWSEANQFYDNHFAEFGHEVQEAKKAGNLSEMFRNYCRLSDPLINHLEKLSYGGMKCSMIEKSVMILHLRNMAEKAIHYACDRNGARITLFVAEDGIECVMDRFYNLLQCGGNTTFGALEEISSTIQNFEFNQEVCEEVLRIQDCVVEVLRDCKKSTPSKLIYYFLNGIYKASPCFTK